MKTLFIATGNAHKAEEIQQILSIEAIDWKTTKDVSETEEPVEDGTTYAENAIIKAKFWAEKTGHWTLSDDSGLEVDALDRRPGLYSARYGDGEDPIEKLLGELKETPEEKRTARFRAVVCLCSPERDCITKEGVVEGSIAFARKGDGGFGYDPIFIPTEDAPKHFSEIAEGRKNQISHRARALQAIKEDIISKFLEQ